MKMRGSKKNNKWAKKGRKQLSLEQLPLYLTLCATQVNGMGCEGASVYDWYVLVCDGKPLLEMDFKSTEWDY